jgi:hypothetical protein
MRTKSQIRGSKSKGRTLEYDACESLQQLYPETHLTNAIGYQLQYDLEADDFVVECKRHKHTTFQEAIKYFVKLEMLKPDGKVAYVIYKNNRQPAMVVFSHYIGRPDPVICEAEFEDYFGIPFKKHTPIKKIKKE